MCILHKHMHPSSSLHTQELLCSLTLCLLLSMELWGLVGRMEQAGEMGRGAGQEGRLPRPDALLEAGDMLLDACGETRDHHE